MKKLLFLIMACVFLTLIVSCGSLPDVPAECILAGEKEGLAGIIYEKQWVYDIDILAFLIRLEDGDLCQARATPTQYSSMEAGMSVFVKLK